MHTILGYELIEAIGEGGMGAVWRAKHPDLGKVVAIKLMDPRFEHDPRLVERFVHEARLLVQLQHPRVVRVENFSRRPLAIVMELVEGGALSDWLRRGPMEVDEALRIFEGILEGVGEAHRLGIVHRDLKPENVMMTAQGLPKIVDFGIARALGGARKTRAGEVLGTEGYMPPEQASRSALDDDARSADRSSRGDIYALGVILHEMLAGARPGPRGVDARRLSERGVEPMIIEAIEVALRVDPEARHPDTRAFAQALGRGGTSIPFTPYAPGGASRPARVEAPSAPPPRAPRRVWTDEEAIEEELEEVERRAEALHARLIREMQAQAAQVAAPRPPPRVRSGCIARLFNVIIGGIALIGGLSALGLIAHLALQSREPDPTEIKAFVEETWRLIEGMGPLWGEDAGIPEAADAAPPPEPPAPQIKRRLKHVTRRARRPRARQQQQQQQLAPPPPVSQALHFEPSADRVILERLFAQKVSRWRTCRGVGRGSVIVWVRLDEAGRLSDVEVRPPYADTPLGSCLSARLKRLRFPAQGRALAGRVRLSLD